MLSILATLACICLTASPAQAVLVIVSDTFTGAGNGATLLGRTPETSLSGGNWVTMFGAPARSFSTTTTAGFGDPVPGTFGSTGQHVSAVSIASAGAYSKPTILRISADLSPAPPGFSGITGPASGGRGIALGFYSDLSSATNFSQNRFTGLVLDAAGNLNLAHDPNATGFFTGPGVFLGSPIAFQGTWDPTALRRLSYTVDTTTGGIFDISLEGSSANYSFNTNLFTNAATNLAGAYISSANGGTLAAMDNFSVVTPEPGRAVLLLLGAGGLALRRRRR